MQESLTARNKKTLGAIAEHVNQKKKKGRGGGREIKRARRKERKNLAPHLWERKRENADGGKLRVTG